MSAGNEPDRPSFTFKYDFEPPQTIVVTREMLERESALQNIRDWVPDPKTLTVGLLARLLYDMDKLWPDPTQRVPDAYVRRSVVLNECAAYGDFVRWANTVLGRNGDFEAAKELQSQLARRLKRTFAEIDLMPLGDAVRTILEPEDACIESADRMSTATNAAELVYQNASNLAPHDPWLRDKLKSLVTQTPPVLDAGIDAKPAGRATEVAPVPAPASPPGDPASRAVAAAYQLRKGGKSVTIRAVCRAAGVDRNNLADNHPEIIQLIRQLGEPDRKPPSGTRDRRTGDLQAVDDSEDD